MATIKCCIGGADAGRKRLYLVAGKPAIFALAALAFSGIAGQALADEGSSDFDANNYDASEFNASTYRDSSFFKNDFRDVKSKSSASVDRFEIEVSVARRRADNDVSVGEAGEESGTGERRAFQENFGVIEDLAGDWVPGKIDLVNNGGFTNYPGNGAPVPYELNGHVDAQRGKP